MRHALKMASAAAALILAGSIPASAAIIDFTKGLPGATSGTEAGGWSLAGFYNGQPHSLNNREAGPGPIGSAPLAGDNDGVGVRSTEIRYGTDYITVTFAQEVRLIGAYFLDLYINPDNGDKEVANISIGDAVDAAAGSLTAVANKSLRGAEDMYGYGELLGISLVGKQFTFFASDTNDQYGVPDFALAALDVAPVPLPAGLLLLPTAIGGLALARRRKKQA